MNLNILLTMKNANKIRLLLIFLSEMSAFRIDFYKLNFLKNC